jgi:hypothetical protein
MPHRKQPSTEKWIHRLLDAPNQPHVPFWSAGPWIDPGELACAGVSWRHPPGNFCAKTRGYQRYVLTSHYTVIQLGTHTASFQTTAEFVQKSEHERSHELFDPPLKSCLINISSYAARRVFCFNAIRLSKMEDMNVCLCWTLTHIEAARVRFSR